MPPRGTLSVWCEHESDLARGRQIDVATYNTSTNTLRRLLQELGLGTPRIRAEPANRPNGTIAGYLVERLLKNGWDTRCR